MLKFYVKYKIVVEMIEIIGKEVYYFSFIFWVNSNIIYM